MQQTVNGVVIYEVGKQQLWDWCGWTSRGYKYGYDPTTTMDTNAESLRKGLYVLVELTAKFGRVAKPCVVLSATSKKAVLDDYYYYTMSEEEHRQDLRPWWWRNHMYGPRVHEYEIWHIVDDVELWQTWEAMADIAQVIGEPVGSLEDVWAYFERNKPTWLDPVIENNKGQSIREYGYEPVQCSICGDVDYGPWVRMNVPFIGRRYFCEDCKEEAKHHGATLVRG